MKNIIIILFSVFISNTLFAQTGIGTTTPHNSSILDVHSTTKGLLIPRMDNGQRDKISNPAEGLMIYNTEEDCLQCNTGLPTAPNWKCFSGGGDGGGSFGSGAIGNDAKEGTISSTWAEAKAKFPFFYLAFTGFNSNTGNIFTSDAIGVGADYSLTRGTSNQVSQAVRSLQINDLNSNQYIINSDSSLYETFISGMTVPYQTYFQRSTPSTAPSYAYGNLSLAGGKTWNDIKNNTDGIDFILVEQRTGFMSSMLIHIDDIQTTCDLYYCGYQLAAATGEHGSRLQINDLSSSDFSFRRNGGVAHKELRILGLDLGQTDLLYSGGVSHAGLSTLNNGYTWGQLRKDYKAVYFYMTNGPTRGSAMIATKHLPPGLVINTASVNTTHSVEISLIGGNHSYVVIGRGNTSNFSYRGSPQYPNLRIYGIK